MSEVRELGIKDMGTGYKITVNGDTKRLTVMLSTLIYALKSGNVLPDFLLEAAFYGAMDGAVEKQLINHHAETVTIDMSALSHAKEAEDNGG